MAQVAIPESAKDKLDIYAKFHKLKIYEALTKVIDEACSGLEIVQKGKQKQKEE